MAAALNAGQGRSFEDLGRGELRDDALRDIGSLLVWIGLQHELDRNRVAVLGENHGAYLALQSLAEYGDRLRGGIAAFPQRFSVHTEIDAIRLPLLLVQGVDESAAPDYELQQLQARLRLHGVDARYLAEQRLAVADLSLNDAARLALISFDAAMKSNLSVGPPLELAIYPQGAMKFSQRLSLDADSALLRSVCRRWNEKLTAAFHQLPKFDWERTGPPA